MKYLVRWHGPQRGHGVWAEKVLRVATEEEGRALVAAPMKAGFNHAILLLDNGGGGYHRFTIITERKRK